MLSKRPAAVGVAEEAVEGADAKIGEVAGVLATSMDPSRASNPQPGMLLGKRPPVSSFPSLKTTRLYFSWF